MKRPTPEQLPPAPTAADDALQLVQRLIDEFDLASDTPISGADFVDAFMWEAERRGFLPEDEPRQTGLPPNDKEVVPNRQTM